MSDGGCARFKQNAWKKDLCSNCYRPREEHKAKEESKPNPLLYLPLKPAAQGILSAGKKTQKKKSVRFTKEETEVIGYGGEDSDGSDEEDNFGFEDADVGPSFEREVIGDEEKALERLTKLNTDFNSVLDNLNGNGEPKVPLQLGKAQTKPIQVVIQPFSSSTSSIAASRKSHLNKLLEDEDPKPVILNGNEWKPEPVDMPAIKTILVEGKKEERGNPEGRKTHITRGSVITKSHEQAKNKLYVNVQNKEKRNSSADKNKDEVKKTIIITNAKDSEETNKENADVINDSVETTKVKIEDEVTVKVLKLLNGQNGPPESREMAGEPDGKADSDEHESPLTPPPRSSFLHREASAVTPVTSVANSTEPKLTKKAPSPVPSTKISVPPAPSSTSLNHHSASPIPPALPTTPPPQPSPSPPPLAFITAPLIDRSNAVDSSTPPLDSVKNKRQAPKPPTVEPPSPPHSHPPPEPLPRLRGSTDLSADKKRTKVKQTLKKLLRLGTRDEDSFKPEEDHAHHNLPAAARPRPQIIHPLDLNKSAVQVLPPHSFPDKSPSDPTSPTLSTVQTSRPSKPPPPPRSESLNLMQRLKSTPSSDNVYVNLGEGRTGIAPVKPQRTGSMRDKNDDHSPHKTKPVKVCTIPNDSDHVYECVDVKSSSLSSTDSSSGDSSPESNPSDLYYPYVVFHNGECKTIMKKRGVVHSTLEENYGAVVVANLEALTQLLKIVNERKSEVPVSVKNSPKLNWESFEVTAMHAKIGSVTFYDATLMNTEVTLAVTRDETTLPEQLEPWSSFTCVPPDSEGSCRATVLKRTRVETFSSYAQKQEKTVEGVRDGVALLLQIVKYLKNKNNVDPSGFIVVKGEDSLPPKACYLLTAETTTTPQIVITQFVAQLLGSLPFARVLAKCPAKELPGVLESWLWGPGSSLPVAAVKRWLDLERANVLQSLVCAQHRYLDPDWLSFLVHSDAPSIASSLHFIYQSSQL